MWQIILWILLGALAGWLAGIIMKSKGSLIRNIILGIAGALVGGFIVSLIGGGVSTFSFWGIIVAIAGACLLIFLWRLIFKKK